MQIKVNYQMSNLDKAVWNSKRHFTTDEFVPAVVIVPVRGLKPAKVEIDLTDWMDCQKQTGMTESEYQARHGFAWSE